MTNVCFCRILDTVPVSHPRSNLEVNTFPLPPPRLSTLLSLSLSLSPLLSLISMFFFLLQDLSWPRLTSNQYLQWDAIPSTLLYFQFSSSSSSSSSSLAPLSSTGSSSSLLSYSSLGASAPPLPPNSPPSERRSRSPSSMRVHSASVGSQIERTSSRTPPPFLLPTDRSTAGATVGSDSVSSSKHSPSSFTTLQPPKDPLPVPTKTEKNTSPSREEAEKQGEAEEPPFFPRLPHFIAGLPEANRSAVLYLSKLLHYVSGCQGRYE